MIKQLKKTDVQTSPFCATKTRQLYNIQNEAVLFLEEYSASVIIPDTNVSLDYIDYVTGTPLLNRECNIALEQQDEDMASFEEGLSGSLKTFDLASAETNLNTGTYKVLLYNQIYRAFYNNYNNPTELLGMENIDLLLNKTNRYLADKFRMFTIPRIIMGDKITPGSIQFQDTSFDDNVKIQDDSNGNLIAGDNLFSKVQEVRTLNNQILPGSSSYTCSAYSESPPPT